jgi:hypothetical protein
VDVARSPSVFPGSFPTIYSGGSGLVASSESPYHICRRRHSVHSGGGCCGENPHMQLGQIGAVAWDVASRLWFTSP